MGLGGFGMGEMIMIFLVVLLLFGAKRLPEIGSSLGKGIREFKGSVREIEREFKEPDRQIHRTTTPPQAAGDDDDDDDDDDDGEPRKLSDGSDSSDEDDEQG